MKMRICQDFQKLLLGRYVTKNRFKRESHSYAAVGPMLQCQDQLLRLPVPPMESTLQKYLLSVKPLLTDEEFSKTEKLVTQFGKPNGEGQVLHQLLLEKASKTENWLSDWWLQAAYLEFRMPVIIYSSPGLVCPYQDFKCKQDQINFAARAIVAAIDYKNQIDKHELPVEMSGASPMDMSQYQKIFSTCRIPAMPRDYLEHYAEDAEPPKHVVVVHNNHYFKLDVYGNDGVPLNAKQIENGIQTIVKQSEHVTHPIGMLSSEHRDTWAKAYQNLCASKQNRKSVKVIQQSIMLVCLDRPITNTVEHSKITNAALQTIHGGGADMNSGNRWFDKTIQMIISEDGAFGFTYEHSPSEGPPIANTMDHIVKSTAKMPAENQPASMIVNSPERLDFELSPETLEDIKIAEKNLQKEIANLDMTCFTYPTYGKEFIKQQKLGPDSYIQMAMQLAFYRLHNCVPATYESATLRKFLHGRTETIRSATVEGLKFCQQMMHTSSTAGSKVAALRLATEAHKSYITNAVNGMGVDRFLFGLKKIALENGMAVPDLFSDASYTRSTHFRLSTSQVAAKSDAVMCYGAAVPDGYGCCYNPRARSINFAISAFRSNPATLTTKYKGALEKSLTEMHDILLLTQSSKM